MIAEPCFDHLLSMSDRVGTFEHADHTTPRRHHGYCTDDVARVLVVLCRESSLDGACLDLAETAMRFLTEAQSPDGTCRNRRNERGVWTDRPTVEDCWGRSLWAFGTAARQAPTESLRRDGFDAFIRGTQQRSRWSRSMAFAALGAAEVVALSDDHVPAVRLLGDFVDLVGFSKKDTRWPWPERRLTYANAVLVEALIAAGHALDRPDALEQGLHLLDWLVDRETAPEGHLSPTPVGGSHGRARRPRFDQQPIEIAALADACSRAAAVTGDGAWSATVDLAIGWFMGHNDVGCLMWDRETGGGYDGLTAAGPNQNQGAESTLALLSTLQLGRQYAMVT